MSHPKLSEMLERIDKSKKAIAKERDKLRDLCSEIEEICTDADEAEVLLTNAADVLSKYL